MRQHRPLPTLVIGLGGTGQWVACHVLKELMELYELESPAQLSGRVQILAIDTDFTNAAKVGRDKRDPGRGAWVGEVEVPPNSMVPVGGSVHRYVTETENGKHPETGAWFDAGWFLRKPNSATLLNLVNGAGQYRPLGRLAIPYNLLQGGAGIRNTIQGAITTIRNQMNAAVDHNLIVCIVGSLCGGTGAGMVVDIAHLVHQIASPIPVTTIGYLVLPAAFEGTVPPELDGGNAFRTRAFAAMRELRRFSRELDYEVGYPMHYAGPDRQDGVLRGSVTSALFAQLNYFDAGLTRTRQTVSETGQVAGSEEPAPVEDGMAPLIAEAILLWTDEKTASRLLSHSTNLTAQKDGKQATGDLTAEAAVAGGMGVVALQLPLYHFVERWAHDLGREILRQFLGVPEHGGEDSTTRQATVLREDWAGGMPGRSGADAARVDWRGNGQVGGVLLRDLHRDHLQTGLDARAEGPQRKKREADLRGRSSEDWEKVLAPAEGPNEANKKLASQFLHPQKTVIESKKVLFFDKVVDAVFAEVLTTASLLSGRGDAGKDEQRRPSTAAQRVKQETDAYLDRHLGRLNLDTGVRGGTEQEVEGEYPVMLRSWTAEHVAHWREALNVWLAQSLNNNSAPDRTAGEQADNAVQNRAGRLGNSLALLRGLTEMLTACESSLRGVKQAAAGEAGLLRNATDLTTLAKDMEKEIRVQERYLERQQAILLAERRYAAVCQAHWAAAQMLSITNETLVALSGWQKALAEVLYRSVWAGQDHVENNLIALKKYGAVRQVIELPQYERGRYEYYAESNGNARGQILNELRWRVSVGSEYDRKLGRDRFVQKIGLQLGDQTLAVDGDQTNAKAYLARCRAVFADAWQHETLLGWLRGWYDGSTDDRRMDRLVQQIIGRSRLALRCEPGANPYRFAYVRATSSTPADRAWLDGLRDQVAAAAGADQAYSQLVDSSDPYRLSFVLFHELIDVEKLTAWVEGKTGVSGAGGYLKLRARSAGTELSRQVLHVFAAERNAAIYEEQLGELLPDRVVALLEDRSQFRLFVQAWAYGQAADGAEILINQVRLPDSHSTYPGKWVYRLTTGRFEDDIDPVSRKPMPAQQRWLGAPSDEASLHEAAESFLLRGFDKWQTTDVHLAIDYDRVKRQVVIRQQALAGSVTRSADNTSLWEAAEMKSDPAQKKEALQSMADYERYQGALDQLPAEVSPRPTENRLDIGLRKVMRRFIAEELVQIERGIRGV